MDLTLESQAHDESLIIPLGVSQFPGGMTSALQRYMLTGEVFMYLSINVDQGLFGESSAFSHAWMQAGCSIDCQGQSLSPLTKLGIIIGITANYK